MVKTSCVFWWHGWSDCCDRSVTLLYLDLLIRNDASGQTFVQQYCKAVIDNSFNWNLSKTYGIYTVFLLFTKHLCQKCKELLELIRKIKLKRQMWKGFMSCTGEAGYFIRTGDTVMSSEGFGLVRTWSVACVSHQSGMWWKTQTLNFPWLDLFDLILSLA